MDQLRLLSTNVHESCHRNLNRIASKEGKNITDSLIRYPTNERIEDCDCDVHSRWDLGAVRISDDIVQVRQLGSAGIDRLGLLDIDAELVFLAVPGGQYGTGLNINVQRRRRNDVRA